MNATMPFKDWDVLDSNFQPWDSPYVVREFRGQFRLIPLRKRFDHPSQWPTVDGLLKSRAPFRVFGTLHKNDTISLY